MGKTMDLRTKFCAAAILLGLALGPAPAPVHAQGQHTPLPEATATSHRTRLILKDGSFQVVMSYRVDGANVRYISAERGGVEEVIPVSLVDLDATKKWELGHAPPDPDHPQAARPPAIDPELLKEEADRAALTPEVAPDLNLPEQDSVLALDTFHDTPELIPLPQSGGELNHNTAHNILHSAINPMSAPHSILVLKGTRSPVQLHVDDPAFYIRIGDDSSIPTGPVLTVDTHGASAQGPSASAGGAAGSTYVIVRTDVRTDSRIINSFNPSAPQRGDDVVATTSTLLPGGHWMKITPRDRLSFGEYALVEAISDRELNLGVWDFGVHPVAPENRDAIKPEPRRRPSLERRRP